MSAQQPAQNDPQIPDSEDSGKDQPLRTRYYYLIMTIMVVIGVVIDIAIFIGIITNAEGRVRIPYLVFILPVVGALAIGRFADAALAKKSPHLVPGYAAPYFQGGQVPQKGQYGQPQYGQPAAPPAGRWADRTAGHCPSHPADCRVGRGARAACSWFSSLSSGLIPRATCSRLDRRRIGRLYEPGPPVARATGKSSPQHRQASTFHRIRATLKEM